MAQHVGFNPPGPEARPGPVKRYIIKDGMIFGYEIIRGKDKGLRVRYTKPVKILVKK